MPPINGESTTSGVPDVLIQDRRHPTKVVPSAPKIVLVTNLDQPNRAATIVPSDAGWAAQSFVTDDSGYWLESIEIIAGNLVGTPSIIAELRGGDATSLGATVATFTVLDLTTDDLQNVKLTPNNPVRLSPNTTYWLVLGTSGDGTFGWTYAEGNEQAGSGTLAQYAYSEDQGVTWNTNSQDSNFYKLEVLVHPASAPKTVLVTNFDQPNRATTMVPSDAGWAAQSFVTDDSDYGLESIEIIAGNLVGTPSIIAELRSGDATSLGATVATFTVPDLTTDDPQNVKLTPNNPVQLSLNTTYWLVLGTSSDGTFGWTYAEGNEQAGSGTLAQYAYSEDQGVTWNTNSQDSNFYKLEVLVHSVVQ